MNEKNMLHKTGRILVIGLVMVILAAGALFGQTATIGGSIYTGANDGTGPVFAPNALTPAITDATVMVQNQHSGGAFITYGTVTGNTWTATVPAPGDYVVMFSAPGHDLTSREFTVKDGDSQTKDAYLPALPLPLANLLVFAFWDNMVNGEPDGAPEDLPLNGVTWTVSDEEGTVLATGVTGSQATITLPDGVVITDTRGLYYFTGLPPGEVIATSDPSTITQAANPDIQFDNPDDATREYYLNYTEEGGPAWDPKLYPGDPGTEAGGFLIWHSYVEKLGQIDASNLAKRFPAGTTLADAGSINGSLGDADKAGLDPDEPFPIPGEDHPGVSLNDMVPDGLVILFTDNETVPTHPVATVEADPVTGDFTFNNVPPGNYKMMQFDIPLDYVWTQSQVRIGPNENVVFPLNSILVPRFFARGQGFVYDNSTTPPTPIAGASVHIRFKSGSIQRTEVTDANGWYNFDDLPEIEVIGFVDVDLPAGYRGTIRTETFFPGGKDPTHPNYTLKPPIDVTFNAMNRYIQWLTANYEADLYLEPIPATKGHIGGFVFNDNFEQGTWVGDGVYDPEEERTWPGVTVELYDASGTTLLATTTTGAFDEAATLAQGWFKPATWPPDELGGVFVGPLPGYYEFRDVDAGTYVVRVTPPAGFVATTGATTLGEETVTVTGVEPTVPANGDLHEVNFGVNTTPSGRIPNVNPGVPLAGEIEGGVFDDVNIDPRGGSLTADPNDLQSLLFAEKAGVDHAPVGAYDHLGYLLGVGVMGNPLCYPDAPDIPGQPGVSQCPECDLLFDPVQKPEMERRFAPGVHIYVGNDPSFLRGEDLNCNGILDAGEDLDNDGILDVGYWPDHPDWGFNPNLLPLTLPYTFGQGKFKFEADWSLVPVAAVGLGPLAGNAQILPNNRPVINNPGGGNGPVAVLRVGDIFRIQGHDFGDQQGYSTVTLAGSQQRIMSWTDTYIDIQIAQDALSGAIVVATSTGISNALSVQINYSRRRARYLARRSVFVDASNTGPQDGSEAHPWQTIGDALNHLPALGPRYVFVAPGTYQERVHLKDDGILLIGSGPHETIINGLPDITTFTQQGTSNGGGPTIFIGKGGKTGSVTNILISGFTITGSTVNDDDIGAGIFGDYGNQHIQINTCMIYRNGGYYGGGIWFHKSNHNVQIWSNLIAENGNFGGYGGGISVNDEPEYEAEHGQPEHTVDDLNPGPPPGTYDIYNNVIFHNWSADLGGGICLYEVKDHLNVYGNVLLENRSEDHGGALFFEDSGPIDVYGNVFLRNYSPDDGGAISFEDVGDTLSHVNVYNNLIAENIADDHGENHARGGAIAFDDTFFGKVFNNTIVGNIVAGSENPAGGGIDSERNGHEYNGTDGPYVAPGFSDPQIFNNIIWNNWRLHYDQPVEGGEEEDLPYPWGKNYVWTPDELHVDNPALQPEWESDGNSESFTHIHYNDIRGGYSNGTNNLDVDPSFVDPDGFIWKLNAGSPAIDKANAADGPNVDLELLPRTVNNGMIDMGAHEWRAMPPSIVRIPTGILGAIQMPIPGSSALHE